MFWTKSKLEFDIRWLFRHRLHQSTFEPISRGEYKSGLMQTVTEKSSNIEFKFGFGSKNEPNPLAKIRLSSSIAVCCVWMGTKYLRRTRININGKASTALGFNQDSQKIYTQSVSCSYVHLYNFVLQSSRCIHAAFDKTMVLEWFSFLFSFSLRQKNQEKY